MAGKRHKGRVTALKVLYEADTVGHAPASILQRMVEEEKLTPGLESFARELVEGVSANRERIDGVIRQHATAWQLDQVSAIDRNILRLAVYEIIIDNRVPMRAVINEAVELAKDYGGESSPKFINGVLGAVSLTTTR